ncbi:MAG: tRNA pseudouridine(55) synthase TruB [Pseudomonadota bacterium]|nr:tRNA pseudouridine(55) synthase TruB [Pseudomonadota bacterium]
MNQKNIPERQAKRNYRDVDGILLLDKPKGLTSNHALQKVRHIYRARKGGHTGSLDPLASGMLPLCFGQATKVSTWLLNADKTYDVQIELGVKTDTGDADGSVIQTDSVFSISENQLKQALGKFRGQINQLPPMYSALKKDGKRLYDLARQGKVVKRDSRSITIHQIDLTNFDSKRPWFKVCCSKGTYVRTLMEDIAESLGTIAHVTDLRRTGIKPFAGFPMINMTDLEKVSDDELALDELLIAPDLALGNITEVSLSADESFYFKNGHEVGHAPQGLNGLVRVYDNHLVFLGVGEISQAGAIAPKRLFIKTPNGIRNIKNQGVT